MPLVSSKPILEEALRRHFAVGAFNANNMEQVQAIVEAAQEERAPVILQVSQGAIRYAGIDFAAGLVKIAAASATIPVVLHLDHGTDFEQNVRCLRAGFTSLMFDGSKKPYEENVATTKRVAELAHLVDIPVEAELGQVLNVTSGVTPEQVRAAMTDPDQARDFVTRTGCDSLAVACGSVHAMTSREATLDIDRIKAIFEQVHIPLVLHGSSGVKHDSVVAAIEAGIAKVNVATTLNQAFIAGVRKAAADMPDETDPRKILGVGRDQVKEAVREKLRLFGSSGSIDAMGGFVSPARQFRSAELGEIE
ncbi:MAG: class II fructose-bisphosphate aldolase [Anaerolineae bacterium]